MLLVPEELLLYWYKSTCFTGTKVQILTYSGAVPAPPCMRHSLLLPSAHCLVRHMRAHLPPALPCRALLFFSPPLLLCIRQHPSAYVSIRQHTSADASLPRSPLLLSSSSPLHTSASVSIRLHTSADASAYSSSLLLFSSAYVSTRQHTSAYVSIRQHTSAYVSSLSQVTTVISNAC